MRRERSARGQPWLRAAVAAVVAVSLLLCAGTCAAWARSYRYADTFTFLGRGGAGVVVAGVAGDGGDGAARPPGPLRRHWRVPHAVVAGALALVPVALLLHGRWAERADRRRRGLCRRCGYDLRATPQRCPECGAEALENAPAAA